ncbi:MAG TPA: hypothetical protein VG406_03710 [Isosphaeraceae bacterium]|nr:hypothetical protein [Isosphaeraceae bacterium]
MIDFVSGLEVVPSLDTIEEEVRAGLPTHRPRLDAARANADFYKLRNLAYIERREGEDVADYDRRPKRTSKLTKKAVDTLTGYLYSPGPTRDFEAPPAVAGLLRTVYEQNHINTVMHKADAYATVNDVAMLQLVGTGDPARPARLYVWGSEAFVPFFGDGNPLVPWAVCTITVITRGGKKRRKYEVWSAKERRVYTTKPVDWTYSFATAGGLRAEYRPDLSTWVDQGGEWSKGANPYGCLPFAFVFNRLPVDDFWDSGIGTALRQANAEVDRELSDLAEHVQWFLNPRIKARNVSANFRMKDRPGAPIHLTPRVAEENGGAPPDLEYMQATLAVEETWYNIEKFANLTFYELDVPLSAVRDDTDGPSSGLQVHAEQGPLLQYTRNRQPEFGVYENCVARMVARAVGGFHGAPAVVAAADAVEVALGWVAPAPADAGPARDESDAFELEQGLSSPVEVLARRRGISREAAREAAEQIKDDKDFWRTLFGVAPTGGEDVRSRPGRGEGRGEGLEGDEARGEEGAMTPSGAASDGAESKS